MQENICMAVKSSPGKPSARQPRPPQSPTRARPPRNNDRFAHDLWGIGLLAAAGVVLVSLLTSHAGAVGGAVASGLRWLVGIGAYAVPLLLGAIGVMLIRGREPHTRQNFAGGAALLFLVGIAFWHLLHSSHTDQFHHSVLTSGGGEVGAGLCAGLRALFGRDISCGAILVAVFAGGVVWATDMRLLHLFERTAEQTRRVTAPVTSGAQRINQSVKSFSEERASTRAQNDFLPAPGSRKAEKSAAVDFAPEAAPAPEKQRPGRIKPTTAERDDLPTVPAVPLLPPIKIVEPTKPKIAGPLVIPESLGDDGTNKPFALPPLTLLNPSPPKPVRMESAVQEKQAVLMRTLNDFKIGANVSQVAIGPTVTRYEVQLEPGILVKKIVSLADNLAMSLAAIDVRVEAPIPGKAAIGIEVPNDVTQLVSLRECLETQEFMNAPSKLTFALGKDVSGEFKYADLARMPHLLVGGSTNSGKSVCLNVIISSILYRATPREVKFVMIDPKRVELSLYDGIPHLLSPVIKNVKQAAGIFRSVLKEMEDRYDKFAQIGTRNLEGYNSRVEPNQRLPFIVLVVDELADLMMQQGPEVETSICRLAQLARATGIHLVIATQRPSVDVITGTIKANISSRIAFAVATQVDSRTIIDMPGADRLIGRGDMLFMPIDASKPVRVQGCYIGERETEGLVKYLNEQEAPNYTMIPSEAGGHDGGGDFEDDGSSDDLFEPCVRWLIVQGQCSTSSLQRKFKIGYTRAARLVEIMEARGIVGPQDGVKPREILLHGANVDAFFAGHQDGDVGQ
jgi:S-DNA-T family DNA segregation ATPase FtsK/SpoIIIE